ncbi:alpha-hydroxy-acid oxidizing protein [Microbacteriaceae bacterium VKM Ac-2854]|nr:alpha-hydroxy-acid oxidizing protein [Microbacteriaceae bacterium VKM Ac-2854]
MTWIDALEGEARAALPDYVYGYFSARAGNGETVADAQRDWDAIRFRPRAFVLGAHASTSTTVLGMPVRTPVLMAPMANQNAADPQAERATGHAAARAGTVLGVSTNTAVPFDEIAATGAPWWFQLYPMRDAGLTDALVRRAAQAGARAIILTVDRVSFEGDRAVIEPRDWPESPRKARLANILHEDLDGLPDDAMQVTREFSDSEVQHLRDVSGLDVLVKGILRGDEAHRAVEAGASGIVVSTHGGRRLGRSISSIAALPEVVAAVGNRAEVFIDSGVRDGDHIAAALALGARAVFVGRPVMWGLATGGAEGAHAVVERLTRELLHSMERMGVRTVADLTADLVVGAVPPAT